MEVERFDLDLPQAARILELSETVTRRLADRGGIPCMRTPGGHRRFRRSDLETYRAQSITGATTS